MRMSMRGRQTASPAARSRYADSSARRTAPGVRTRRTTSLSISRVTGAPPRPPRRVSSVSFYDDFFVQLRPALALIDEEHRVDDFQRAPIERGANLSARWNRLAVRENLLAVVADHEFVVQQGRMRMRGALDHGEPVAMRDRGRKHEPVERRPLLLELLGGEIVDGERERHFARGHHLREKAVPSAHRQAVLRHQLAEQAQAFFLPEG